MFTSKHTQKPNPRPTFNFFARIWYFYLNGLFLTGSKRPLTEDDLWGPPIHCKADNVSDQFEAAWEKEKHKKNPSVGLALLSANRSWILTNVSSQVVIMILRIGAPVLLSYLLDWFADPITVPILVSPESDGYIWALFYSLALYAYVAILGPRHEIAMEHGHIIRVQINTLLYKKLNRLNLDGYSQITTGKIVNIMSNDVARFEMLILLGSIGLMTPFAFAIIMYLIYRRIGTVIFATIVSFIVVTLMGYWCGVRGKYAKIRYH